MRRLLFRRPLLCVAAPLLALLPASGLAADKKDHSGEFYAFDNGVGRGSWTPEQQAKTLKELGYAGIGYSGFENLEERVKAFKAEGLTIYNLYVQCQPAEEKPGPEGLEEALKLLRGSPTMLWLTVRGKTNDEDAVKAVRAVADAAEKHNVKVALYPHYGFYVATTRDAIRIAELVDRDNLGVSINLCHELRAGNVDELPDIIKEAAPRLFLVSINGAERRGQGWQQLIQTLDQGEFDMLAFLKQLKAAGYKGPMGLQCYNVKGDHKENLAKSMKAWKQLRRSLREEKAKS